MNRNERKSTSMDFDFGLGLNTQLAESSGFEKAGAFPFNQYRYFPYTGGGGGPIFWNISSTQACGTVSGKSLFTASQLQELERQQIINKYMMASIPVPHELMLPISRTSSQMWVASGSGADSRFSSSKSDAEPWRCRRTDGKKWRCSRNVAAADQRYCERHAHKNKPRSRKHVETSQFPAMAAGLRASVPYDQARRMRGGSSGTTTPVSTCNYRQQLQNTSPQLDFMNTDNTKNVSQSQTLRNRFEFSHGENSKMTSFRNNLSLNLDITHETPQAAAAHFIDAWEEGIKGLSPSSLTLSMSMNRDDEGNENGRHFGIGMDDYESNSAPGGPLGEALCVGNASNSNFVSPNGYIDSNST